MTPPTKAEMVAVGLAFHTHAGRQPSRADFRGDTRREWGGVLGCELPTAAQVEREFGSWGAYLEACGFDGSEGNTYQQIERAAAAHAVQTLGITEETAERSVTDGWLPDGRTVEIKGSVLRKHERLGTHFFAFKTHGRVLSASTDLLVCVGLSRDLSPIVRLEIPKAAMPTVVDGKNNLTLYANAVWGPGQSQLRRFIRFAERLPLPEAITRYSA